MHSSKPSKIKVGTTADYEPFSYFQQNIHNGFDIELIQKLANNLDITVQFITTTWANLAKDLEDGLFDMAVGAISLTERRLQKFLVSSPIMFDGKAILANKKHYNKIKTLADVDVPEMTVIVNIGGTNELFVKENIRAAKVITTDDNMSIFNRLAMGEADVMFTDRFEAIYRQNLDPRLYIVDPAHLLTAPVGYGYIYRKDNLELRNTLEASLKKFMAQEDFKILFTQFFNFDISFETCPFV